MHQFLFFTRSALRPFLIIVAWLIGSALAKDPAASSYTAELKIPYATVDGKMLTLNAFLPPANGQPAPAVVEIHGGWFMGGGPADELQNVPKWELFARSEIAVFSISYRLGAEGGFPQNIRDCRNAVRFIRNNAACFNIDPNRIGCMGGSAGGHLSLMVAMVPEDFNDGGPTPELAGVSAKVCSSFSWIPPTDFVRFWNEAGEGDTRARILALSHGIAPDTAEHEALYDSRCPNGHVRKDVPPLLICDGEKDSIIPGLQGRELHEKLRRAGADSTYWITQGGGHGFPDGPGFSEILSKFIERTLGNRKSLVAH